MKIKNFTKVKNVIDMTNSSSIIICKVNYNITYQNNNVYDVFYLKIHVRVFNEEWGIRMT